jgi:hypothetical protein
MHDRERQTDLCVCLCARVRACINSVIVGTQKTLFSLGSNHTRNFWI